MRVRPGEIGEVTRVFVEPAARGKGVGRLLMSLLRFGLGPRIDHKIWHSRTNDSAHVVVDLRGFPILQQALMRELERKSRELGLDALRLDTRTDLVEARSLYSSLGYIEGEAHNSDPYANHWFRKELL